MNPHLQRTRAWLSRNSRRLSVAFVVMLGGFAAAAFSVAPLLPDPADQPQRLVIDTIATPGMHDQLEALADQLADLCNRVRATEVVLVCYSDAPDRRADLEWLAGHLAVVHPEVKLG